MIESSGGFGPMSIGVQFIQGPVAACKLVDAPRCPVQDRQVASPTQSPAAVSRGVIPAPLGPVEFSARLDVKST